ncbi:MAG: hypothetical protein FWG05_00210 [Kiritimatiellaeota bacterium]|nr:hypothetical protein [Kiritimatiellota bacterium]
MKSRISPLPRGKTDALCAVFCLAAATFVAATHGDSIADFQNSTIPQFRNFAIFLISIIMTASALTVGVAQRRRQIALLRCSGMTRDGVARIVMREAARLTAIGWALGLGASAFIKFPAWQTIFITALVAFATCAVAAIIPVMNACRVRPLEAIDSSGVSARGISVWKSAPGLVFLCLATVPANGKFPAGAALISFAIGVVLCFHAFTRLAEIAFARPVGALVRLDPRLFTRRLSRAPERVAGVAVILSLGLAVPSALALAVISIAAAILLTSSARASENEIRAFHASGMTRGQLARLFFGEALLMVICAVAVGLAGGAILGAQWRDLARGVAIVAAPPLALTLLSLPALTRK